MEFLILCTIKSWLVTGAQDGTKTEADASQATIAELAPAPPSDTIPVVVINTIAALTSATEILDTINRFAVVDDVFSKSFAATLVLQSDFASNHVDLLTQVNSSGAFSTVYWSHPKSDREVLPSGPYFLRGGDIHQAWRLYEDELDSFIFSVIPDNVLDPKR